MKFLFHPEAETEFAQAIEYYEEKEEGLGYDFAVEVYSTIERILAYPKAWPILEGENQKISGQKVSVWNPIRGRRQRNFHCCCDASSSRSRILETQNISRTRR